MGPIKEGGRRKKKKKNLCGLEHSYKAYSSLTMSKRKGIAYKNRRLMFILWVMGTDVQRKKVKRVVFKLYGASGVL